MIKKKEDKVTRGIKKPSKMKQKKTFPAPKRPAKPSRKIITQSAISKGVAQKVKKKLKKKKKYKPRESIYGGSVRIFMNEDGKEVRESMKINFEEVMKSPLAKIRESKIIQQNAPLLEEKIEDLEPPSDDFPNNVIEIGNDSLTIRGLEGTNEQESFGLIQSTPSKIIPLTGFKSPKQRKKEKEFIEKKLKSPEVRKQLKFDIPEPRTPPGKKKEISQEIKYLSTPKPVVFRKEEDMNEHNDYFGNTTDFIPNFKNKGTGIVDFDVFRKYRMAKEILKELKGVDSNQLVHVGQIIDQLGPYFFEN